MKIKTLYLLYITISLFSTSLYAVETTNKKVVTNIESDRLNINKKNLTSIFTGNVTLKREKLVILADKIIVVQKKDAVTKKNKIDFIEAYGNPATLTDVNKDNEKIDAFAKNIFYNQNNEQIKLKGDAKLLADQDNFTSQIIWYNKQTKEMKAGKIKEEAKNKTSRVKIQFFE